MAGTRTAPTIDGTPTTKRLSIAFIDSSGDLRSVSFPCPTGALDATLEAVVAAVAAATRASVWKAEVAQVYEGAQSPSNAELEVYEDVHDNLVWLLKDNAITTLNFSVPAPISPDCFDAEGEQPDSTDPLVAAVTTALDAVWGSVTTRSIRFSKRQDRGVRVKV